MLNCFQMVQGNIEVFSKLHLGKIFILSQALNSLSAFNRIKTHTVILQILSHVLACKSKI